MKLPFRRKVRLDTDYYQEQWQTLMRQCSSRKTWPLAVIDADKLLCEALKKSRYKGKTTGERLVASQRILTNNEAVWFGHKLSTRIGDEDVRKLKKSDIMQALTGFRQALRDLGALEQ
jgi:hypothetical protein